MKTIPAFLLLAMVPAMALAGGIDIRRNTVIEVTADQDLNIKRAQEGDRFTATVRDNRDLPSGSQLVGEVLRVEPKSRDQAGFMDLEFRAIVLPDGTRQTLSAVPINLDNKAISRSRDGRMVADTKRVKSETMVLGGMLGGLILGSLVKKPFEGAFVGILAGILVNEANRKNADDYVLRKGTRLGALFTDDVSLDGNRDRDRDRDEERGNGGMDIRLGGRSLTFGNQAPYWEGKTPMVPLDDAARQMDLTVDRRDNRLFIEDKDNELKLTIGETSYRLNGAQRGDLPTATVERNGVVFVPLFALAMLTRELITVNGSKVSGSS